MTPVSPRARRRSTSCSSAATQSEAGAWLTVMAPGQVIDTGDLPAEFRDQAATVVSDWLSALEQEAARRLARGESGILDELSRQFERALITQALKKTGGRRIEAANLLGMGRNTITRKIQELGIDDAEKPENGG